MNLTNYWNKKWVIVGGFALLFVFLLTLFLIGLRERTQEERVAENTPLKEINLTRPYEDYSNINLIKPGISTEQEGISLMGKTEDANYAGGKKYLIYKTPFKEFKNLVVIKDGKVYFALENVFGNYRGGLSDYQNNYGEEDLILYETDDEGVWHIFLENGLAVKILGELREVFYFIPQDRESFLQNFSEELSVSEKTQEEEPEVFIPEP